MKFKLLKVKEFKFNFKEDSLLRISSGAVENTRNGGLRLNPHDRPVPCNRVEAGVGVPRKGARRACVQRRARRCAWRVRGGRRVAAVLLEVSLKGQPERPRFSQIDSTLFRLTSSFRLLRLL